MAKPVKPAYVVFMTRRFAFATIGDLLLTYERLRDAGISPYWPVHHGTSVSMYSRRIRWRTV